MVVKTEYIPQMYFPVMLVQENYWWLDRILHSYQSRIYSGDVGASFSVSFCVHTVPCYLCDAGCLAKFGICLYLYS